MEKSSNFYSFFHPIKCSSRRRLSNDRISSLPDEVLLTILSFLPLKEMVNKSILSTRWLNLWVNTPVLDFHHDVPGCDNTMRDYVVECINHVLQQYKGLYLKKFRICCNFINVYQKDIDRWLEFALTKKLEVLDLDFLESGESFGNLRNYDFPDHWFSSGKDNLDCSRTRVLQSNLKCLQLLSLENVNVTGETINFFLQNCPFLERLELVGNIRLVNLVISDPTLVLKYVQILHCPKLKVLNISNVNLVSLDTTFGDLNLKDLPMLVEFSILGNANCSLRHNLSKNATCLRQLESLTLRTCEFEEITEVLSNLAEMTKLKRLVLNYAAICDVPLIELLSILQSCSHLEEFVLELDWIAPERSSRIMWKAERHSCLSLKRFEFKGYYGRVSDFELIIHLVKNAPGLEKIIIHPSHILLRTMNYPETATEEEARRFALIHIQNLKEFEYVPPHVDVLIQ